MTGEAGDDAGATPGDVEDAPVAADVGDALSLTELVALVFSLLPHDVATTAAAVTRPMRHSARRRPKARTVSWIHDTLTATPQETRLAGHVDGRFPGGGRAGAACLYPESGFPCRVAVPLPMG